MGDWLRQIGTVTWLKPKAFAGSNPVSPTTSIKKRHHIALVTRQIGTVTTFRP